MFSKDNVQKLTHPIAGLKNPAPSLQWYGDYFKKNPLVEETESEVEKQMKAMFDGKDLNLLEADLPKAHVLNKLKISNFVRKLNRATLLLLSLIMLLGLRRAR